MKKIWLTLAVSLAAVLPASAAPNWLGPTGLLLTPTADTVGANQWNAAYHHIFDQYGTAVVNFGVTSGLEIGGLYLNPENGGDDEFTANAKLRILPETGRAPAVAFGWLDIADQLDSTPYGVVSMRLTDIAGRALRGHLGVGGGVFDGVFGGLDLPLAENLSAMAEYDGDDVNAGIRWALPRGFRFDAGVVSDDLGIGLSYNAGF